MKTLTLVLVACLGGVLLSACTTTDYGDTACSGFLGCSAGVRIVPPVQAAPVDAGTTPTGPLGRPAVGINAVVKGMGCGQPPPAGTPTTVPGTPKGYKQYTVMGTGATLGPNQPAKVGPRTFWVRVPADYDPNKAYKVVYIGQGCGSFNNSENDTLQLYKEALGGSEQAIYVALDIPMDNANMNCYDNRDGPTSQEWEAFELFHTVVDTNYCVDNNRVYVSGYSTGGWLSNMWGCYFASTQSALPETAGTGAGGSTGAADGGADAGGAGTSGAAGTGAAGTSGGGVDRKFAPKYHIRAQAAVTGGEPANNPPCNGPVAAMWIHDAGDNGNAIQGNIDALTRVGKMNGCNTKYDDATAQVPWHPEIAALGAVCKQFKGCPADYPVVFCTTNGLGHADQHERAIPGFKLFFDQLNPLPP